MNKQITIQTKNKEMFLFLAKKLNLTTEQLFDAMINLFVAAGGNENEIKKSYQNYMRDYYDR